MTRTSCCASSRRTSSPACRSGIWRRSHERRRRSPNSGRRRGGARARPRANGSIISGGRSRCWPASRRRRRGPCSPTTASARCFMRAGEIELYRTETTNYRDNLASGSPSLWVVLRETGAEPPYALYLVTADPAEGEGMTEAGGNIVEPVPMPEPIREIVAAFVAEHHVERQFFKRKRDRADPESLGRAARRREGTSMTRDKSRKISSSAGRAEDRSRAKAEAPPTPCAAETPAPERRALARADAKPAPRHRCKARRNPNSTSQVCRRSNSITAATDIRAFLAPGVPAELTRAALRRAWTADPAIRDSSASRRTPGTSPIRPRCRVSARCRRATTSRNWWRNFRRCRKAEQSRGRRDRASRCAGFPISRGNRDAAARPKPHQSSRQTRNQRAETPAATSRFANRFGAAR